MSKVRTQVEEMVKGIDPVNFEFIMVDNRLESKLESAIRYEAKGNMEMVGFMIHEINELAHDFSTRFLTPANVKVGDGVTMHMYSDSHAGTVVKVTKTTITVQQDIATLDPNWKPEIVAGGFAGHCTNQDTQTYSYEQNPNGETRTFRWSAKYGQYRNNKIGMKLTKGRREFYDYNF